MACVRLGIEARQDLEGGALLPRPGRRSQARPLRLEAAGPTAARTGTPARRLASDQRRMPIYRVPRFGRLHMREWRRGALHTVGLLFAALAVCAVGLVVLDSSAEELPAKVLRGLWNAVNLVTTLGDFTSFDQREKIFMMATMGAFLMIGGYALSRLTGILSSDAVMALRENRTMERQLGRLANHVIVIGFGPLGVHST
jgi:hypothetical protein